MSDILKGRQGYIVNMATVFTKTSVDGTLTQLLMRHQLPDPQGFGRDLGTAAKLLREGVVNKQVQQ